MKMNNILSLDQCNELIRTVSSAFITTYEAMDMECCEEEIYPELLGVSDYSEVGLCEGDTVSVYTFIMTDNTMVHILYKRNTTYSIAVQTMDGEIVSVKKL